MKERLAKEARAMKLLNVIGAISAWCKDYRRKYGSNDEIDKIQKKTEEGLELWETIDEDILYEIAELQDRMEFAERDLKEKNERLRWCNCYAPNKKVLSGQIDPFKRGLDSDREGDRLRRKV